ncbi:hypothetical protein PYW07_000399 [Mythimna separata]|uniref:LON peptidase N-terminal domain and RING finger protein 1 n=1 Tax=Mythimna separata TaxID=271217 RepID=A0AAD7Z416_MYTSE|nr:hypothetical protein PYW07_000399 [Mythimna separata]
MEEEYHDANFHGADEPGAVDLLFDALDSYAAVQRTSTMQPLPCECTEVRSTDMATQCLGGVGPRYPHLLYYSVPLETSRHSSPERDIDVSTPSSQTTDHMDVELDALTWSDEDDMTLATFAGPLKTSPSKSPVTTRRLRSDRRMAAASRLSSQVANRLIKFARCVKNAYDTEMSCLNCGLLPVCPITGQCGHTRCYQCAVETICPCGNCFGSELYVNVLIQDLIRKATTERQVTRSSRIVPLPTSPTTEDINATMTVPGASRCHTRRNRRTPASSFNHGGQRIPMTPLARYNHALGLLRLGENRKAVPYLALAAASGQPDLKPARALLAKAINALSNKSEPRELTKQLSRAVGRLASMSWINSADLECILCYDTFTNPVTTPCGHVFCRTCLERTLDYGKRCPLCLRNLIGFVLSQTRNTLFLEAALHIVNVVATPPPLEPDLIPIFVCTVAYPSVPCPLFIFDPRYWLMIRRVLESGSRRFGMVACERGQHYANYGTILEVRDCVHLEDGRSILSTIGISRFKVLERGVRDGCDVARIMPITDAKPRDQYDIKALAQNIMFKALLWLDRLNSRVLADIEAAFGALDTSGFHDEAWWEGADGPSWLWWLIAVLPLRTEIKVLILSTDCLAKRMLAVARTLDAVAQPQPSTSESQYER